MKSLQGENGAVLVVTLLVLLSLTVLGLAVVFLGGLDNQIAVSSRAGDQALYAAEAGLNWGVAWSNANAAGQSYATASFCSNPIQPTDNPACAVEVPIPADLTVENAAGTDQFPGGASVGFGVSVQPDYNQLGQNTICNLVGYSTSYGEKLTRVDAVGYGPGVANKHVRADISGTPTLGLCPPDPRTGGGYGGSS